MEGSTGAKQVEVLSRTLQRFYQELLKIYGTKHEQLRCQQSPDFTKWRHKHDSYLSFRLVVHRNIPFPPPLQPLILYIFTYHQLLHQQVLLENITSYNNYIHIIKIWNKIINKCCYINKNRQIVNVVFKNEFTESLCAIVTKNWILFHKG